MQGSVGSGGGSPKGGDPTHFAFFWPFQALLGVPQRAPDGGHGNPWTVSGEPMEGLFQVLCLAFGARSVLVACDRRSASLLPLRGVRLRRWVCDGREHSRPSTSMSHAPMSPWRPLSRARAFAKSPAPRRRPVFRPVVGAVALENESITGRAVSDDVHAAVEVLPRRLLRKVDNGSGREERVDILIRWWRPWRFSL